MNTKKTALIFFIFTFCFTSICFYSSAQAPEFIWAQSGLGDGFASGAYALDTDVDGNVFMVGSFTNNISFGSITLVDSISSIDLFIVKYDALGNAIWAKMAQANSLLDIAYSVTTDAEGNVFVVGQFECGIAFDSVVLTADSDCMFIVKYDANGNLLWAKCPGTIGGGGQNAATAVSTDINGNIIVGGAFTGNPNFDAFALSNSNSSNDMFLVKYDPSGNVLWAKSSEGSANDRASALVTDNLGNIVLSGSFSGASTSFENSTLTNSFSNTNNIFIVKYDALGNLIWAKSGHGSGDEFALSIAIDANKNIMIAGSFNGNSFVLGSDTLAENGDGDMFLAKCDSSGIFLWAKKAGSIGGDVAYSLISDAIGNIYVAGYFSAPAITFGSNLLMNVGEKDIFIVKYNEFGNIIWAKSAGGNDSDIACALTADALGNIYVSGMFCSPDMAIGNTVLNSVAGCDVFLLKLNSTIGLEELINDTEINLYPNPSSGKFAVFVQNEKKQNEAGLVNVCNLLGELVFQSEFKQLNSLSIDISEKPNGVYFLTINISGQIKTLKFIKY